MLRYLQLALFIHTVVVVNGSLDNVRMIDHKENPSSAVVNAVFRSSRLVDSDQKVVHIEELRKEIYAQAEKNHVHLRPKVYIVDICLLHNNSQDGWMVEIERSYFSEHPEDGRFVHHPIWGTDVAIEPLGFRVKRDLAVGVNLWLNDSLAQVVELARSVKDAELDFVKALNANDTSVVAVIHCRAGRDRTGEASAAYRMGVLNFTLYDALMQNLEDISHSPHENMMRSSAWYCFWLQLQRPQNNYECEHSWHKYAKKYHFHSELDNDTYDEWDWKFIAVAASVACTILWSAIVLTIVLVRRWIRYSKERSLTPTHNPTYSVQAV